MSAFLYLKTRVRRTVIGIDVKNQRSCPCDVPTIVLGGAHPPRQYVLLVRAPAVVQCLAVTPLLPPLKVEGLDTAEGWLALVTNHCSCILLSLTQFSGSMSRGADTH